LFPLPDYLSFFETFYLNNSSDRFARIILSASQREEKHLPSVRKPPESEPQSPPQTPATRHLAPLSRPTRSLQIQTRTHSAPQQSALRPHAVGAVRGNSAVSCGDRSGSDLSAEGGPTSRRQRLEGSFEDLLERAKIHDFWFHDLRHTFASWYMMNGGDLYELAKLLGHANIKMTERYAKLGHAHITKTGNTAKVIWSMLDKKKPEQEEGGQEDVA
jgi:hypothetical protein